MNKGKLLETIKDQYDPEKFIRIYENLIIAKRGDGTLLRAIQIGKHYGVPFWGVNAGTVGFLMNEDFPNDSKSEPITKDFQLIRVEVTYMKKVRDMSSLDDKEVERIDVFEAFNDVMIGGDMNSWIQFDVSEPDNIFDKFKGGGLIISTPQGSTGINKNNSGVILPLSSKLWSVTGDKTDRKIEYVIQPRLMTIKVESRTKISVWVDGANQIIRNVKKVKITQGSKVQVMFSNYDEFKKKRRVLCG
jgi:NAD+ kinase